MKILLSLLLGLSSLAASAQVQVAVISLNDFHSGYVRSDYKGVPGAPSIWQTVDSLKRVYPAHVVVAGGDNFGGSYFYSATKGWLLPVFFNDLGIQVSALGNHEFDDGQRSLAEKWHASPARPEGWDISYVCANVRSEQTGQIPSFAQPVASVPVALPGGKTIRVAFAGLITSMTPQQASVRKLAGLNFDGKYKAVLDSVMQLPEASLVNDAAIRVLLTHIGTEMNEDKIPAWVDKDAANLYSIDSPLWNGILTSHTHEYVNGFINDAGYPVVQGMSHGRYLGVLLCTVDTTTLKVTRVEPKVVKVTPKDKLEAGPARLQAQIDSLLLNTKTAGGTPIGEHLAFSEKPLEHNRLHKMQQTGVGTLVCKAYAEAYRTAAKLSDETPIIGCSHFGSIRTGLPQGPISVIDLGEALPFSNNLKVYRMTGKQITELVQFGVNNKRFGMLQTGNLCIGKNAAGTVTSLIYVSPKGKRKVLLPKESYYLVADEFMTTGGDGYDPKNFPEKQAVKVPGGLPATTDAFINYLKAVKNI